MTGRVIQGFFISGPPRGAPAMPQRPVVGPPPPAFVSHAAAVQTRGAPGSFAIDPARIGLGQGGGKPLPDAVRGQMEAALGADFSGVRVHVGPQAGRIGAIAFTMGNDVYFAPGRYQPDTLQGKQLLGHELAHVVQQRAGRVRAPAGGGVAVVQDRALEAEADRLGNRAAHIVQRTVAPEMCASASIQRDVIFLTGDRDSDQSRFGYGKHGTTWTKEPSLLLAVQRKAGHTGLPRRVRPGNPAIQRAEQVPGFAGFMTGGLSNRQKQGGFNTVYSQPEVDAGRGMVAHSSAKLGVRAYDHLVEFAGNEHLKDANNSHAEDKLCVHVQQETILQHAGKTVPEESAYELAEFYVSASPCTSLGKTSTKTTGCTENLIEWHKNGIVILSEDTGNRKRVRLTIKKLTVGKLYKCNSYDGANASYAALQRLVAEGAIESFHIDAMPNLNDFKGKQDG